MTQLEIAQLAMHGALDTFLDDNSAVYAADTAFSDAVTEFKAKLAAENGYGPILSTDNKPYSAEKEALKNKLADLAADLCGLAYVGLKKAGKTTEANQLAVNPSDYSHLPDAEAGDFARANYNLIKLQLAILSPDYIVNADITDFDNAINNFIDAKGTADSVNKSTPAQRAAFKAAIADTNTTIDDLKLLARKYKTTNALFYSQLISEATVINVNVHHTSLNATITNSADNSPITGATATLSNSKKTGTTDMSGTLTIDEIGSGEKIVLTVKAAGYHDNVQQITILRGKANHFNIPLIKL